MEKLQITICCGTYCHVMGGADLHQLEDMIPPEISSYVNIRHSTCLGFCKDAIGNPPFVNINGKAMAESSVEKIILELKILLERMEDVSK